MSTHRTSEVKEASGVGTGMEGSSEHSPAHRGPSLLLGLLSLASSSTQTGDKHV